MLTSAVETIDTGYHTNNTITDGSKSPPIFISGVKQITIVINLLNDLKPGKYTVKALHNEDLKVQPMTGKE